MRTSAEFPLLLAAVRKREEHRWKLGDALLEECGPPPGGHAFLREVAELLQSEGYKIDKQTLSRYRNTAHAFGVSQRNPNFCWEIHEAAGSPEWLDAIIAGTPQGTRITSKYIKSLRRAWLRLQKFENKAAASACDPDCNVGPQ